MNILTDDLVEDIKKVFEKEIGTTDLVPDFIAPYLTDEQKQQYREDLIKETNDLLRSWTKSAMKLAEIRNTK